MKVIEKLIYLISLFPFLLIFINKDKKEEIIESEYDKVEVYAKGDIVIEGLFEFPKGADLNDLVRLCKKTDTTDLSHIDLSEKLISGAAYDFKSVDDNNEKYTDLFISGIPNSNTDLAINQDKLININTATLKELELNLKGVGAVKAQNIIKYRKKNKFLSIEELLNVEGITKAIYDKNKDRLTI
jgi:competence protein ComEA